MTVNVWLKMLVAIAAIGCVALSPQSIMPFPKIKQQINLRNSVASTFYYNSLNQLVKVESSSGATSKYFYTEGKVVKQDFDREGKLLSTDTLFLDRNNHAYLVKSNDGVSQKFEYDSLGRPTKSEMNSGSLFIGKNEFRWDGANQLKLIQYNESNKKINAIYYYYNDKLSTISEKNMCRDFFNRHTQNLVSESVAVSVTQLNDTTRLVYQYEFTVNGNVSKKITRRRSGELVDSIAFIYY